jgi:hypothetical protein
LKDDWKAANLVESTVDHLVAYSDAQKVALMVVMMADKMVLQRVAWSVVKKVAWKVFPKADNLVVLMVDYSAASMAL